jgi:hypothetical protein
VGESSLYAGFLFGPSQSLTLVGQSSSLDQLSGGLAGDTVSAGVAGSPLSLTLFGSRRQDASVGAGLTFVQSPRLAWHVSTRVLRDFPTDLPDSAFAGNVVYPGVTKGQVGGGLTYSLSRRTQIGFDASYGRSYSSYEAIHIATAGASIDHVLTPHWFAHLGAGYGALVELHHVSDVPIRREYTGSAGIGTKVRTHTFLMTARRGIADSYGLGAGNTTGGEMAWNWHRPNGAWTLQGSVVYERLAGRNVRLIQGWLYQVAIVRQITPHLNFAAQGVYASDSGQAGGGFANLMRRGVRLSINWMPRAPHGR